MSLSNDIPSKNGLAIAYPGKLEKRLLNGCDALVNVEKRLASIPVYNPTDTPITLYKHTVVAEIQPVEVQDCPVAEVDMTVPGLEVDGPICDDSGVKGDPADILKCIDLTKLSVSASQKNQLMELLSKYLGVISCADGDLGRCP